MTHPLPELIGYFPKRRVEVPEWFDATAIERIASVSECISPGPDGWLEQWKHNDLLLFDSPSLAASVIENGDLENYDIMHYRAYPFCIDRGTRIPRDWASHPPTAQHTPEVGPHRLSTDELQCLGYDLVCHTNDSGFGCSPLSCNGISKDWRVNAHCLIDDEQEAFQRACELEAVGAEPGPYCVIEVSQVKGPVARFVPPHEPEHE